MSTTDRLDLTDAVEAAAQAHYEIERRDVPPFVEEPVGPEWADVPAAQKHPWREYALPFVAAAAPLIAQQVAEQIAQAIERERRRYGSVIGESPMPEGSQHSARDGGILYGLDRAAGIAREWGEPE